ncbi:MAG: hypothetical protein LJE69_13100 [Thiohalocapsa sp.]|jgi:hypothetical protein|uniref:hypothetical protein n=1 Tax=Thiohalocapsa sp. TaxID=2497641 RepID=UPI0025F3E0A2|nr:hypothetical protein [Thiohalocapsa sp.]MCG6942175.1 hypothetical protein [Thiohalocapsa sp.]
MANQHSSNIKIASAAFAATMLLGVQTGALAVECKGMEKSACEKNAAQCTWVDPYTRKDGAKVNGYCRTKGGKKSASTKG